MKNIETKTFEELGFTESYVRSFRPNGWEVGHDEEGNTFAVREV